MDKETQDYEKMLLDVAAATNKQVNLIADKLGLNKQDAFMLMQTITIEKLTYLMAQILEGISSTKSRSAVTEEHTNKDTPSIVT